VGDAHLLWFFLVENVFRFFNSIDDAFAVFESQAFIAEAVGVQLSVDFAAFEI
jgi:hypothetical protein